MAAIDVPPFARSMMDGFAIHQANLASMEPLSLIDNIHAGDTPRVPLKPGTAIQVRTGAPIPEGAAAVVRNEWIEWLTPTTIQMIQTVKIGESIQLQGEDARKAGILLRAGDILDGQTRSVLRSAGVRTVRSFAPCSVAILCTGNELLTAHTRTPKSGQIFSASDAFLRDAILSAGATVQSVEYIPDDAAAIEIAIKRHVNKVDFILLTGGASVGDTDFAKVAIAGACRPNELALTRVWMRPGAPFIGARAGNTTIFGMSGNPAACFIQFHVLALPAIRRSMGDEGTNAFPHTAALTEELALKPVKHVRFYRAVAKFNGANLAVFAQSKQSSGSLMGLASANAVIRLDESHYHKGDFVPVLFTRPLTLLPDVSSVLPVQIRPSDIESFDRL